jgi:hypothetical protein
MLMLHQQPLGACGSASEDASPHRERCCSSGAVEQAARQSTGHNGHAGRTAAQHDDGAKRAHEHDLKCATFRSVYGTFTVPSSGDAIVVVSPLLPLTLHVERNSHSVVLPPVAPMMGRSYDRVV